MMAGLAMRTVLLAAMSFALCACNGGAMFEENITYSSGHCQYPAGIDEPCECASALGCVTKRNIAALAENPDDLSGPRQETPRDAMRRDKVLSGYFQSRSTSAAPSSVSAAQTGQPGIQP